MHNVDGIYLTYTDDRQSKISHIESYNSHQTTAPRQESTSIFQREIVSKNGIQGSSLASASTHEECREERSIKKTPYRRKPQVLDSTCQVCGNAAPNHAHYGSVSCFSCRAFFRRGTLKFNSYVCARSKSCCVAGELRKNCQYCRYQTCLRVGMRPSYVMTEGEKREKMHRKMKLKPSENRRKEIIEPDNRCVDRNINGSVSGSDVSSADFCEIPLIGEKKLDDLLVLQCRNVSNQVFGKQVAHAIAKYLQTEKHPGSLQVPRWALIEILRVQYCRFSNVAQEIDDFTSLPQSTQKVLLESNLNAISIIRLAYLFNAEIESINNNLEKTHGSCDDGDSISFASQLCEIGFDSKMAYDVWSNSEQSSYLLSFDQLFSSAFMMPQHISKLQQKLLKLMNWLSSADPKMIILFQIVNLFNTSSICQGLDPKERKVVDAVQEKWSTHLYRYIQDQFGDLRAVQLFPKIINVIYELQLFSEKLILHKE